MHNYHQKLLFLFMSYFAAVQYATAQNNPVDYTPFKANASVQGIWDSNFSRSPLNDSEQAVLSSASLGFDDTFGRQRLIAKWTGSHYQYDKHSDFDGATHSGQLAWKGLIGSQINTDVSWSRDSYFVDRLEFFGKDIVNRDDFQAKIGYGNDQKLSFHVGTRKSKQRHSNDARISLDFDEEEAFVDVGYQTNNKSSLFLRFRSGERTYLNPPLEIAPDALNFDYDQIELEGIWAVSPKTNISAVVGSYKRKASLNKTSSSEAPINQTALNEDSGSVASLAADWQATEKLKFNAGYSFKQPAIGETSDSPSQVQQVFASVAWQYSTRIAIESQLRYSLIDYENTSPGFMRTEHMYNFSPLSISYSSGRHWLVRLESGWRKNESPLAFRNYVSRQASAGLFFYF